MSNDIPHDVISINSSSSAQEDAIMVDIEDFQIYDFPEEFMPPSTEGSGSTVIRDLDSLPDEYRTSMEHVTSPPRKVLRIGDDYRYNTPEKNETLNLNVAPNFEEDESASEERDDHVTRRLSMTAPRQGRPQNSQLAENRLSMTAPIKRVSDEIAVAPKRQVKKTSKEAPMLHVLVSNFIFKTEVQEYSKPLTVIASEKPALCRLDLQLYKDVLEDANDQLLESHWFLVQTRRDHAFETHIEQAAGIDVSRDERPVLCLYVIRNPKFITVAFEDELNKLVNCIHEELQPRRIVFVLDFKVNSNIDHFVAKCCFQYEIDVIKTMKHLPCKRVVHDVLKAILAEDGKKALEQFKCAPAKSAINRVAINATPSRGKQSRSGTMDQRGNWISQLIQITKISESIAVNIVDNLYSTPKELMDAIVNRGNDAVTKSLKDLELDVNKGNRKLGPALAKRIVMIFDQNVKGDSEVI